ncbi:hypothetical protein UACE39S_01388 [Ureibacillus acetophenoni]
MKRVFGAGLFLFVLTFCFGSFAFAEESVLSGVPIKGELTSTQDRDTYQFTTDKDGGVVYITLDETGGGFELNLYNENNKLISNKYISSKGGKNSIAEVIPKGTYYIKVIPYNWSNNGISSATYRLKATFASSFTHDQSTFEPNDTNETAFPLKSGQFYTSVSETSLDRDTYQIITNKDGGVVYITLDETDGGFELLLYDENRNIISNKYISSKGGNTSIAETVPKGTYYIRVTPYNWSNNGISSAFYRLKATYASPFTHDKSTYEPNDTNETAFPIKSNLIYKSKSDTILDRDTYQFTTNKDGEAYITLDETDGGFELLLYDENRNIIANKYISSKGANTSINTKLAKGTYYIRVTPYNWSNNGIKSANYQLKATFSDNSVHYADLRNDQYWSENMLWAIEKKLMSGYLNVLNTKTGKYENLLRPNNNLTEAQFLTVLFRYGNSDEIDNTTALEPSFSYSVSIN